MVKTEQSHVWHKIIKKKYPGCIILHNQKLAGAYELARLVHQTSTGTWTVSDKDTAQSVLAKQGVISGPVDRLQSGVVKGVNDALTATIGVDICMGPADVVCLCEDMNESLFVGNGLEVGEDGSVNQSSGEGTADVHDYGLSVAEEVADGDTYLLMHMGG